MKDLNEFKAFAWSKTQMNALAGGSIYCQSADDDREIIFSDGFDLDEAQAAAEQAFQGGAICEEEIRV